MKTTLNIDDRLLDRAKALAAREGKTLTAVVEEALKARLAPKSRAAREFTMVLPTVKGNALPQIDVADREALLAVLDEDE